MGENWLAIRQDVDESNPYVMRYVRYIERHLLGAGGAEPGAAAVRGNGD